MKSGRRPSTRGFSLVELSITIIFLIVVLGVLGGAVLNVQRDYVAERQLIEAQANARATMETIVRFVRMAGNNPQGIIFDAVDPDPDRNTRLDSIRLRGDWNPADGDLEDHYEDIVLGARSGIEYRGDPTFFANITEFTDSVGSLSFSYRDADNAPITDPIANQDSIAFVDIELRTEVAGAPDTILESSATMRIRED